MSMSRLASPFHSERHALPSAVAHLVRVRPMRIVLVCAVLACIHTPVLAAPPEQMPAAEAMKEGLLVSAPFPDYSFQARKQRLEGTGIFELKFDLATGHLREIHAVQSTGHALLDGACIRAFKQWRIKPHSVPKIRVPVNFRIAR